MKQKHIQLLCFILSIIFVLCSIPISAASPRITSVSLSANGPSGTLGPAGGEISSDSYPASYTVYATASGCNVTKIAYTLNGRTYVSSGSSVTITANTQNDFYTSTFTAYTDVDGVTATFTVNFKYVSYSIAYYMWETFHEVTIRSITGNGLNKALAYTMSLENSYDYQANLSEEQVATIQSLIGRYDGKTYTVNYTRKIQVYTPASLSYNGEKLIHGLFDGNNPDEIETCLSTWGWGEDTKSAIRQAASSYLTFTTSLQTDCTAIWINSSTGKEIYSKKFAEGTVSPSQSKNVSVSYSEFSDHDKYVFEKLTYSGDESGSSTSQSFSQIYTSYSKPLTVTFYCHPKESAETPEESQGTITVYVRDAETNAVISGASVSGADKTEITGSTGKATFSSLAFGSYTFIATKSGYISNSGTGTIKESAPSNTITIYLTKDVPIDDGPTDDTKITVYVRDSQTYAVISGAYVSGGNYSGYTNNYGYVSFSGVEYDTYAFTATCNGYNVNSAYVTVSSESLVNTITVYLTPNATTEDFAETGNITICVYDDKSWRPVEGVAVTSEEISGITDSSGFITFSDLEFGTYNFTAFKEGYTEGNGSATISISSPSESIAIFITPIVTCGTVNVTVKDKETNAVIPGAEVTCGDYSGTTDTSGNVKFEELPFDTYSFTASAEGYEPNTASVAISLTQPNKSTTIYLTKKKVDVGVIAESVNGTVYRGSTIIVSAEVFGDESISFTPGNPLIVTLKAIQNGDTVFDVQTKNAICPKGETNLVWFTVDIPKTGYISSDVIFTFTVTAPETTSDSSVANDISSKIVTTYVLPDRSTPDVSFELSAPSDFIYSTYKTNISKKLSWTLWEWDNGFVQKTYSARLTVKATLTPDKTSVWSKYDSARKLWYTRSGYGINTVVNVSLDDVDEDMFAGNAKVNAYYPEFNYSTAATKSSMLRCEDEDENGYYAEFAFEKNMDTISEDKMHVTPVWFPDGEYSVKYEIYDLWTPAGVLTANTYAIINIEGSMYDDYYTQRN